MPFMLAETILFNKELILWQDLVNLKPFLRALSTPFFIKKNENQPVGKASQLGNQCHRSVRLRVQISSFYF